MDLLQNTIQWLWPMDSGLNNFNYKQYANINEILSPFSADSIQNALNILKIDFHHWGLSGWPLVIFSGLNFFFFNEISSKKSKY